jgi:hypothetical protein
MIFTKENSIMALFFLTYDLRKSRDYQTLYNELHKFSAVRILESTWCFNRININAAGLRDYFINYIDSDDGLVVSEVSDWGTFGTEGSPNDL